MAINKVIYGGKVLIDLTGDTITPGDLKSGVTAHDKAGVVITGNNTYDVDSSDATASVAEILLGKTAYARGSKITGTMPNNGAVTGTISAKGDSFSIVQGYHDGSGKVSIDSIEQGKIVPDNIRQGITILGVEGAMSGSEDVKAQEKTVKSSTKSQIVKPDKGFTHLTQVTVEPIAYVENENSAGGMTATIG